MALLMVGEFDQKIDSKNRVAIPQPLREHCTSTEEGENFYIVLGTKRHLWLYPELYYRRLQANRTYSAMPDPAREQETYYHGLSRLVKPDSQGRICLPDKSRERAAVTSEVTLVGGGDHIEVWPKQEWDEAVNGVMPRYDRDVLAAGNERKAGDGHALPVGAGQQGGCPASASVSAGAAGGGSQ